jgi:hypothetical protein
MFNVAPEGVVVLIPTRPDCPNIAAVFKVARLALVIAKTFGAESALEAVTFPETLSVEPVPVMLIPTDPNGPKMDAVLSLKTLALVVALTTGAESVLEAHALPVTLRDSPAPTPPIPTAPYILVTLMVVVLVLSTKTVGVVILEVSVTKGFTFPEKIE